MGRNEHRIARNHHILPFFGVIVIVNAVNYMRMTVDAGYGLFVQRFLSYSFGGVYRVSELDRFVSVCISAYSLGKPEFLFRVPICLCIIDLVDAFELSTDNVRGPGDELR